MLNLILYIVTQAVLIVVWAAGVMDRTFANLVLATLPTSLPYLALLLAKGLEKAVKKFIEIKTKTHRDGQEKTHRDGHEKI